MKLLRKILCAIGVHRWGSPQDYFPPIPSEEDCAYILYDRAWPNYPYRPCMVCGTRRQLPKTFQRLS